MINLEEFGTLCSGEQVIAYMRRIEDHWMDNAKAYFEVNGIEQPKRIEKPRDLFHIKGIVDRDEEIRYRPQKGCAGSDAFSSP